MQIMTRLHFFLAFPLFSSFAYSSIATGADGHLSVFPNVCHIEPGSNVCSVQLEWNEPASRKACIFVRGDAGILRKVVCRQQGRIKIRWINEHPATFELRAGSDSDSPLIAQAPAVGIRVSGKLANKTLSAPEVQKERVTHSPAFAAGAWDGRLFFGGLGTVHDKMSWYVQLLRPEKFEGVNLHDVNFGAPGAFSPKFLLDSDSLTNEEISDTKNLPLYKALGGLEQLGMNHARIANRVHLAVFPHPGIKANPYRSNSDGTQSFTGNFETYRFFLVCAPTEVTTDMGTVQDPLYPLFHRHFLAVAEGMVTVEMPRTRDAKIIAATLKPARPLRDTAGNLMIGYEPGVSLDGRLITYSGTPLASTGQQHSYAMYTFQPHPLLSNGWSAPANLSDMYYLDGPGATHGETSVDGLPFSARFPLAKYPIADDHGNIFPQGQPVRGSYLWLSPDASEIVMSTAAGFYGARRGTVMVGARTMGTLQYVDGPMNPVRGNPADDFTIGPWNDYFKTLAEAYDKMPMPNAENATIKTAYENVLFSMVFARPGSWDAFKDLKSSPFAQSSFTRESYGFFISPTGRFAEVPVLDLQPDLLLAMPMNESLKYDRALIKDAAYKPLSAHPVGTLWGKVVAVDPTTTPDLSQYHQTGVLRGAQFPYEYYDVKGNWRSGHGLMDRSEGAYGNSIFMTAGTSVGVAMKSEALARLLAKQQLTVSFWFRKSAAGAATLIDWPGLLQVRTAGEKVIADLTLGTSRHVAITAPETFPLNSWTHVAVSFQAGAATLFMNGEKKAEAAAPGFLQSEPAANLTLGPVSADPGLRIDLDEVFAYALSLKEEEITKLAFRAVSETEWPNVSSGIARNSSQQGLVAQVPSDNPYSEKAALLGKRLFESTTLSNPQKISCASCHRAGNAFADLSRFSLGATGESTTRNSPALSSPAFSSMQFWDGRAPSLESQVLHPIFNPGEMNLTPAELLAVLNSATWKDQFRAVYGKAPTLTLASRALASYVRSISSGDAAFDRATQHDPILTQLTPKQQVGWRLFSGRANCIACHSGPNFTDGQLHDTGLEALPTTQAPQGDEGAYNVDGADTRRFSFKTPSLRNLSKTAPYFHDGRAATLEEVVEFYNRGGDPGASERPSRSVLVRPLDLSPAEKADLVEFLHSLESEVSDVSASQGK